MEIIIYGTPTCPACTAAKKWFDEKEMSYTYITVGKDISVEDFAEKTETMGVPVIYIDGTKYLGFNPNKLVITPSNYEL